MDRSRRRSFAAARVATLALSVALATLGLATLAIESTQRFTGSTEPSRHLAFVQATVADAIALAGE